MFKRILQIGLILVGSASMPSWAVSVGGVDVGAVDTLLAVNEGLGNPTAEETWVNSVIAPDTTSFTVKIDPGYTLTAADLPAANILAFDMTPNTPDYFLVKNATMVALFENVDDLNWGVIDVAAVDAMLAAYTCGGQQCKINLADGVQISHVSLFGGGSDVPEPGVLGLLGIGLLGMVLARRRMAA